MQEINVEALTDLSLAIAGYETAWRKSYGTGSDPEDRAAQTKAMSATARAQNDAFERLAGEVGTYVAGQITQALVHAAANTSGVRDIDTGGREAARRAILRPDLY